MSAAGAGVSYGEGYASSTVILVLFILLVIVSMDFTL